MGRPDLTSTFARGPILECLLEHLPIVDLRNLQLTCRQFGDLYSYALPSRWNVDRALQRFVPDPVGFRHELTASTWEPGDMDVYVPLNHEPQLHNHLIQGQGYQHDDTRTAEQVQYPINNVEAVRTYSTLSPRSKRVERIQVISIENEDDYEDVSTMAIESILEGFHCTTVLNYLTGTEAVSTYPNCTFGKRRRMFLKKPWTPDRETATMRGVKKYVERGWALHDIGPRQDRKRWSPLRKARHTKDAFCWRIDFGPRGSGRKALPYQRGSGEELPVWWTMPSAQHVYESRTVQEPGGGDRVVHKTPDRLHYYPIRTQGYLRPSRYLTQLALSRLSVSSWIHELGGVRRDTSYCACYQRIDLASSDELDHTNCVVTAAERQLYENGRWTLDQVQWIRRIWSITSVGEYTPMGEMIRTAEADAMEEDRPY
ncbi:hypothetical protein LTR86_009395 [Recurvomyces mirabilis]|nr:hypothetical protein LTR86_009395 [Recurvomyces mirabilis]